MPPAAPPSTVVESLDEEGVLLLTLDRPARKNAFDEAQWDALAASLDRAREDPRVAVVVLTGAGGHFSSGVDLAAFTGAAGDVDVAVHFQVARGRDARQAATGFAA